MDILLDYLQSIHRMSDGLVDHLRGVVGLRVVGRKEYLLLAGEECENLYFIKSGLLRCYYLRGDTEVTSWMMKEGDTVVAVESFYGKTKSYEFIHALEKTEVYYISRGELEDIFMRFPEFNYIGRVLTVKYLRFWAQQLYSIRMRSAREKYVYLMEENPDLLLRVPQKYIASYLDMLPETLSRIKDFL